MEKVHLPLEKCPHKDKLQDRCLNHSAGWEGVNCRDIIESTRVEKTLKTIKSN